MQELHRREQSRREFVSFMEIYIIKQRQKGGVTAKMRSFAFKIKNDKHKVCMNWSGIKDSTNSLSILHTTLQKYKDEL